jgi:hypothetical protein
MHTVRIVHIPDVDGPPKFPADENYVQMDDGTPFDEQVAAWVKNKKVKLVTYEVLGE